MKIFLLVSSFPCNSDQSRGIFNYFLVKQLLELKQDVFVGFFRMWIPGRKIIRKYSYNDISVTEICLPLIPSHVRIASSINRQICNVAGGILLKKQIKRSEVIHSVYLTNNGIIAGQWASKVKIPHISQAIGSDINSDLQKLVKNKRNIKWIKRIDGIITNSEDLERLLRNTVLNCPPIKTIYRGIRIPNLKKITTKQDKFVFLYLGGLVPYKSLPFGTNTKGGITLMEAWKKAESELFENNSTLQFGGPNSNNNIFQKWKKTLKYPERVELIGKIAPADISQFLTNCDIVVIPSMEEGLPNFLLESAASKKPAIGSTAGGIPEVIINEETGYIFEKGNVEQLSNLLLQHCTEKEKIKKMGEAAYKRVKNNFNSENYGFRIISFYKKIMEKCAE